MTSLEIVFSDGAENDFNQIAEWYKEIREGLDLDFILCLEIELELIRRNYLSFKEIKNSIRRTVMHRFPYNVYYTFDEKIVVLGIIHHKRSKNTISKKLKRK